MTTAMPPEMTTTTAPPTAVALQRDSLSRSRFMITDILAGSAAAAAAAMHNGSRISTSPNRSNSPYQPPSATSAAATAAAMHQQQQQHAVALQHYLAQQQHLLQQHQQQQQHHMSSHPHHATSQFRGSPPPASLPHHAAAAHHNQFPGQHHPLAHLPPNALLGFPGPSAAQAAAHYAALQHERERLRDLDSMNAVGGAVNGSAGVGSNGANGGVDGHSASFNHDDHSRSPLNTSNSALHERNLNGSVHQLTANGIGSGIIGGGNGGGSISGDQASTIDDSDSDSGAKDDDCNSSIKSDNLMGLSKKQRKARTAFTDHQLQTLEKSFERQKYLSVQDRMELANKLELSDCQVKTWYQNRRTKWKRQTAVGLELLAEAGNYAAFQRLYGGSPYLSAWPYAAAAAAQTPHGAASASAIDIYYRQAAAAVALQKPLTYRMYHPGSGGSVGMPMSGGMPPMHPAQLGHLGASNSLSSLSSYYQAGVPPTMLGNSNGLTPPTAAAVRPPLVSPTQRSDADSEKRAPSIELSATRTTPSPQLNPGSPPERLENNNSCLSASVEGEREDEDDAIEV